jgi:dTDP-4-dehydrorhamnose 3,5-epimerase
MFTLSNTSIQGVKTVTPIVREDSRGIFVKTFHAEFFAQHGLAADFREQYYSFSKKGVLRGMHFQLPPHDHDKLVTCIEGEILDAVLDLRKGSPTYGQSALFALSGKTAGQLYIPKGLAHGFYVTSESATVLYNVTTVYAPQHDTGLRWDSAGIAWPDKNPLVSDRDAALPPFSAFESSFIF